MNNKDDTTISVNGNVTPITRQPILEVRAHKWHEMTVAELYDQKSILDGRYIIAAQIGNEALMQQLQIGLGHLIAIINSKITEDINLA